MNVKIRERRSAQPAAGESLAGPQLNTFIPVANGADGSRRENRDGQPRSENGTLASGVGAPNPNCGDGGSSIRVSCEEGDVYITGAQPENDNTDREEPSRKGPFIDGTTEHVKQLLCMERTGGVRFPQKHQLLRPQNGWYEEGREYMVKPGTRARGYFGIAAKYRDVKSSQSFVIKTVKRKALTLNEIAVPLKFADDVAILKIYAVHIKAEEVCLFLEDAGLSLEMVMKTEHSQHLRSIRMMLRLALPTFGAVSNLHYAGIMHGDIKPANLCLYSNKNYHWIKIIDFGLSQTMEDIRRSRAFSQTREFSESDIRLQMFESWRQGLRRGMDVRNLTLSLLYCAHQGDQKRQDLCKRFLKKPWDLSEGAINGLMRSDWPDAVKELILNTLRVDPNVKEPIQPETWWSARQAADVIHRLIMKEDAAGAEQHRPVAAVTPAAFVIVPSAAGYQPPGLTNQRQPWIDTAAAAPAASAHLDPAVRFHGSRRLHAQLSTEREEEPMSWSS